ncbi:MAG: hypothetical protein Fur0037_04010 [Planctomycetota bacterium]
MSATFLDRDFKAYERHRQDDPEYNGLRLSVRRKLKALVDGVQKKAKEAGVELSAQAGPHHPHVFNGYRVREQRAYLCRSAKERRRLASFFGDALGQDAKTHYIQTVLELSLDDRILEAALRIHPMAWWDGQHFRKRALEDEAGMASLRQALRALPDGFALQVHDWRQVIWCRAATPRALRELLTGYTPGEHWMHVRRQLPKEDAIAMGQEAAAWVETSLLALLPVYRLALWEC